MERLIQRFEHLGAGDLDVSRQTGDQVTAAADHGLLLFTRERCADVDLQKLCGTFTDVELVLLSHVGDDRLVHLVAGHLQRGVCDDAAERDDRDVGGAAADIDDHDAFRTRDVKACTDGCRDGLFHQEYILAACLRRCLSDRTLFYFRDA